MSVILIVIRKDLKWKSGPIIAQAAHAVSGLIWSHSSDSRMIEYMTQLNTMTKVVYKIPNLQDLHNLKSELDKLNILFFEWIESPENVTTCIAFGPLKRNAEINMILEKYNVKLY